MEHTVTVQHPSMYHDNWGLVLKADPKTIRRFNRICRREFWSALTTDPRYDEKKAWGAFHQGSSNDWSYWEFWMPQTEENRAKVFAKSEEITAELGQPDPDADFWGEE